VLALEAVVKQLDAYMWIDARVVDKHTGETPLMVACGAGSVEIVEALLKVGAEVRQASRHDDDATAFTLSVMSGNWRLVELLRKHNTIGLELSSLSPLASASNFLQLANKYEKRTEYAWL
jgi:ankyrin repeat protein